MIAAVVPVKALAGAKSRLLTHLAREHVERLSMAMLGDVVEALRDVPALEPRRRLHELCERHHQRVHRPRG